MKIWILLIGCFVNTSIAGEIIQRDMYCDDTAIITQELRDKYKEIPVIVGKTADVAESVMTFWTNPTENTWTILATNKDFSCVVGTGNKLTIIDYKRKKNI